MTAKIIPEITQEYIKSILDYAPETGSFTWKKSRRYGWTGRPAGSLHHSGYHRINIYGKFYQAHRLAWMYVHGVFPEDEIDHLNHVRDDNRICNLRSVRKCDNSRNRKLYITNNTGIQGVGISVDKSKWRVRLMVNSKTIYGGVYSDFFEACCKRMSLQNEHGYHENHGR